LTQSIDGNGLVYSAGSEIRTNRTFSYGTFEFRIRFSSDSYSPDATGNLISGSVGAAFLYLHEPFSEIDIEVENSKPDKMHTVTWLGNERNKEHFEVDSNNVGFKTYKIVWEPEAVSFYVDGNLVSIHMSVVPTEPSHMFFNHWGTDSKWWGGNATIGQDRYVLVDYFSYVPLD
jgi:beta-glucanase (GH16 family)